MIEIIFVFIGLIVAPFTILSAILCVFFGIPVTAKLEKANFLIPNSPIVKRYLISFIFLLSIFGVIAYLVYLFTQPSVFMSFLIGSIISTVFSLGKVKINNDNVSDYIATQHQYFAKSPDEVAHFLLKN